MEKNDITLTPPQDEKTKNTDIDNTDSFNNNTDSKKRKKLVIWSVVGIAVLLIAAGVWYYADRILNRPQELFNNEIVQATPTPTPDVSQQQNAGAEPSPEPTHNYLEELRAMGDFSDMKDVFNVLLIGVDYADERKDNKKQYVNKDFNADVMLLLAVNFNENRADLISVPRDTFARIDNAPDAPYKLNFSLTLGGGITNEGFTNVCKSVEWAIGGVPVNYYIAVTMPMLKDVVDTFGGVDYDIDLDFKIQGRKYTKGLMHLDGQGVLDYCRVRKNVAESGDKNRVNRQKKMMLTVYRTIREKTEIKDVPNLIKLLNDNVYTNLTLEQCAALAYFGNSLNLDEVNMYSLYGPTQMVFNYAYVFPNQKNRLEVIKTVYGVDVEQLPKQYTLSGATAKWNSMQRAQVLPRAKTALKNAMDSYTKDYNAKMQEWENKKAEIDNWNSTVDNWSDPDNPAPAKKSYPSKPQTPESKYSAAISAVDKGDIEAIKSAFDKLGIKCNYSVSVYKKGQVPMKE